VYLHKRCGHALHASYITKATTLLHGIRIVLHFHAYPYGYSVISIDKTDRQTMLGKYMRELGLYHNGWRTKRDVLCIQGLRMICRNAALLSITYKEVYVHRLDPPALSSSHCIESLNQKAPTSTRSTSSPNKLQVP
jgi:hypothetical protein